MLDEITETLIALALQEDIGRGDITSDALIDGQTRGQAAIIAQEEMIVCGQEVAAAIYARISPGIDYNPVAPDGARIPAGSVIAEVSGSLRVLLSGERVVLNFLQRLSGVATAAAQAAAIVGRHNVTVLDTRKTVPGWRTLDKYAVRTGGGSNHRTGLFDAVLIKNNHIDAMGGRVADAVRITRERCPAGIKIEVEVRNMEELQQAVAASPDAILLDNMSPAVTAQCAAAIRAGSGSPIEIEASGGIHLDNLAAYAAAGVDTISLGFLTHSVRAAAIALRYKGEQLGA